MSYNQRESMDIPGPIEATMIRCPKKPTNNVKTPFIVFEDRSIHLLEAQYIQILEVDAAERQYWIVPAPNYQLRYQEYGMNPPNQMGCPGGKLARGQALHIAEWASWFTPLLTVWSNPYGVAVMRNWRFPGHQSRLAIHPPPGSLHCTCTT